MVPPNSIKRDINVLIASNPTLCLEEPRSKKPKIFEKSCIKHPADDGVPKSNKKVSFAEEPQLVYFRKIDSSRSLLKGGHDPDIEEYNPNNLESGSYLTDIPPPPPEKRILKRSVSHFDLDLYWGDELDSQLTRMNLGKVNS
ncbi:unnamed protein product [Umbelopsis sp. WA50703]|jgi:hypothetical protein